MRVLRSQLESLVMQTPEGEPALAAERVPIGAMLIDRPEVAFGIIELPPNGVKQREKAPSTEVPAAATTNTTYAPYLIVCVQVFFVASGQRNCVATQIQSTEFKLSKGDSFLVPGGNSYSVRNTSTSRPATLFFSFVKQQPPLQQSPEPSPSTRKPSKGNEKRKKAAPAKGRSKRRS